jgi:branched-chain amino acid aminotransferase
MGSVIWLDGELRDAETPSIRADDRGFTLADNLFETLRVRDGAPGLWKLHAARLRHGLGVLGLKLPHSIKQLEAILQQTLEANQLRDAAVRITVSAGPGPRGLKRPARPAPTVLVTAGPLPPSLNSGRVIVARSTRRNEHSPLSQVKTAAGYPDQLVALREAEADGAADALVLNTRGRLTGATTSSLILCRGNRAMTPSLTEGALPGTVRAWLLQADQVEETAIQAETLRPDDTLLLINAMGVRTTWLGADDGPLNPAAERIARRLNAEIFR